jgi:hypothetical protein
VALSLVVSVFDVDCCVVDNSSVVVSVFDVDCCVVDNSSVVVSVFDVDCCVVDNSICVVVSISGFIDVCASVVLSLRST